MKYLATIKFLLAALKIKGKVTPDWQTELKLADGAVLPADIYEPAAPASCLGTILFFHGMNKLGKDDERMMRLGRATAMAGFRAVVPTFPLVARHIVDKQSVLNCACAIRAIIADPKLCQQGQLGIFTASFSGSASIRAITQVEGIAPLVSSLCSVGVCYHPDVTFTNILSAKMTDKYAKYICIKALLRIGGDLSEELERALDLAIDREFDDENTGEALQQFLASASAETQEKMRSIIEDVDQQREMAPDYQRYIPIIERDFEARDLDKLRCHTTLIHSAQDMVLPTLESELLYKAIRKEGQSAKLLVTPILDHADVQLSPKYIVDALRLVSAFHSFFKHI